MKSSLGLSALLAVLLALSGPGRALAAGPGDAGDDGGGSVAGDAGDDGDDGAASADQPPALACDGALCATDPGFTTCGVAKGVGTGSTRLTAWASLAVAAVTFGTLRRRGGPRRRREQ